MMHQTTDLRGLYVCLLPGEDEPRIRIAPEPYPRGTEVDTDTQHYLDALERALADEAPATPDR